MNGSSPSDPTQPAPRPAGRGTGIAVGALIGLLVLELGLTQLVSYWGQKAPLVAACALLGGVVWPTRLERPLLALAAALGALWLLVAFSPLAGALADGLVRRDPVGEADLVFVFGSSLQPDGDLTPPAMSRLLHGLELVAAGRAPRLVLSELEPPQPRYAPEARLLMHGLRLDAPLLEIGPVRSTRDEARLLAELCRGRGYRRVLAVSSPLHSRRACAALEREGLEVRCSPGVETSFDVDALQRPDDRLAAFGSILHERLGIVVYSLRGWI